MKRYIITSLLATTIALTGCKSFDPSPEQMTAIGNLALTAAQIAAMYRHGDGVYRVAICVGVYTGDYGTCIGADTDAVLDAKLLTAIGYDDVRLILNEQATRQNIIDTAYAACANLKPNDLLYIKGSSHGGQRPNPQEPDGMDEFFCAADGPLLDDDIWTLLCQLPPGVRVILALDTCNSGTMYRAPHNYTASLRVRNAARPYNLRASLLYIGGCADGLVSYGDRTGGQLSNTMRLTLPRAATYDHWLDLIRASMPPDQIPVITKLGPDFAHLPPLY